jgi:hypothetical protein
MSAKIDYTRAELTGLKSQIEAQKQLLGGLLDAIKRADSLLNAREALGEEPLRANIESKYTALKAGVDQINGLSLSVKSKTDFMDGFDNATNDA